MPADDYGRIGELKSRCIRLGFAVKKSELLRAGLQALTRISDDDLAKVVSALENVKTGRPPKKAGAKRKHGKGRGS
jgi:hypothetical protein